MTHDLDFGALVARANARTPSIIQIRADDLSVRELGAKLIAVVDDITPELLAGALVTIDLVGVRVRILPIRRQ